MEPLPSPAARAADVGELPAAAAAAAAAADGRTTGAAAPAAPAAVARPPASQPVASVVSVVPSEVHHASSRHILVGIDNSSNSKHALEWAIKHMYRQGDKFHLVHIVPEPPTMHLWTGVYVPPDNALESAELKEAAVMVQAAFAPLVTRQGVPSDVHLIVAPQDPSSIVNVLLDKQADLDAAAIVVAPHTKGVVSEWWLGSVTKGLLRHSPVPVVVVPPDS